MKKQRKQLLYYILQNTHTKNKEITAKITQKENQYGKRKKILHQQRIRLSYIGLMNRKIKQKPIKQVPQLQIYICSSSPI